MRDIYKKNKCKPECWQTSFREHMKNAHTLNLNIGLLIHWFWTNKIGLKKQNKGTILRKILNV